MRIAMGAALVFASVALGACGAKEEPKKPAPVVDPDYPGFDYQELPPGKGYPITTCVVDDKPLTANRFVFAYKAYEIQLCNKSEMKQFGTDPETYTKKAHPRALFDR